jgi:hypothetical protein
MSIHMDSSTNRALEAFLAVLTLVVTVIAAKILSAAEAEIPEGYEDATGFHVGQPRFFKRTQHD